MVEELFLKCAIQRLAAKRITALDRAAKPDRQAIGFNPAPSRNPFRSAWRHRLVVRIAENNSEQRILLLTEEQPVFAPALLETLGLTHRESEVLHWVAEGKSNPEIGIILDLSPRTVSKHLENIFQKLGVESRTAALLYVMETLGKI